MKTIKIFLSVLLLAVVSTLGAQVTEQYDLTLEGARKVMDKAMAFAQADKAPGGAIAIVDNGGHLLLLERMTGTFPAASDVSYGKARTAALFRFESKKLEDGVNSGRPALLSTGEVVLKGGVPILYKGKVVGAIGVSGAASADQDVKIAEAGAAAIVE